jgi:hypothetical protein
VNGSVSVVASWRLPSRSPSSSIAVLAAHGHTACMCARPAEQPCAAARDLCTWQGVRPSDLRHVHSEAHLHVALHAPQPRAPRLPGERRPHVRRRLVVCRNARRKGSHPVVLASPDASSSQCTQSRKPYTHLESRRSSSILLLRCMQECPWKSLLFRRISLHSL